MDEFDKFDPQKRWFRAFRLKQNALKLKSIKGHEICSKLIEVKENR